MRSSKGRDRVVSGGCHGSKPDDVAMRKILVVDDDQLVRDMTLRRLTKLGYRAIAAASGAEALEALASGADIDLLLTDIRMPGGLHGPALAKEARRLRPQIKVLFVSGAPTTRCCRRTLPTRMTGSFSSSRAPRPSWQRRSTKC